MDVLYIGDIPSNFHYARYGSNYIDLYNRQTLSNGTYQYYRVYLYDNFFTYDIGNTNVSQYNTITCRDIEVSNNFMYRRDIDSIFVCVLIFSIFFVFLANIFTSIIKKGVYLVGYYKKKLSVVLLVFLFILFFVNSLSINSYALTDVLNAETVIIDDYEQNEVSFIAWAYDYLENNGGVDNDNDSNVVALTEFMQEIRAGRYVYYQRYSNTGRIICWCYDGRSNNTWQSGTYVTWSGNTS